MKLGISSLSALVAVTVCVLSGCASAPKDGAESPAAPVEVYRAGKLSQGQYESVRYLWVDTWRSAFWLPGASTEAEGIASLQAAAARLGANGLININCLDQGQYPGSGSSKPSVLCYGHAIRVR